MFRRRWHLSTAALFPLVLHAQSAPAPKLPDDFAKSAFKTLKMIEGEIGQLHTTQDGRLLAPRDTKAAIDSLDADAATPDEQTVIRELRDAFNGRLAHNTQLETAAVIARNYLAIHGQGREPADIEALLSKVPQVSDIRQKNDACFLTLENKLRSRDTLPVLACSKETMSVPSIDISDVRRAAEQQ